MTSLTSRAKFYNDFLNHAAISSQPTILSEIYQDTVNIAIWKKPPDRSHNSLVSELIKDKPQFKAVMTVTADNVIDSLSSHLSDYKHHQEFAQYTQLLVDMFCTLFDLKRVGLRLTLLNHPMCPKFHIDNVPCRLVTTFAGPGTEWLPNGLVDRNKLGKASAGYSDKESGIYRDSIDIQQMDSGDVALLKGEGWFNNQGGGLVHRSPQLVDCENRLLL